MIILWSSLLRLQVQIQAHSESVKVNLQNFVTKICGAYKKSIEHVISANSLTSPSFYIKE